MAQAARAVTVVPFTQRAEAVSGADWIWWWMDGAHAYGMLVQAKRFTVTSGRWGFGFGYKVGTTGRLQRNVLFDASAALGVLPTYALYLGTGDYRSWARCSNSHQTGRCLACVKRTISLMPALLAEELIVNDAISTYERSVALEDLWSSPAPSALLSPVMKSVLAPELAKFLTSQQAGTRAIARSMIDPVLRARAGAFSATQTELTSALVGRHDELGPIFPKVPNDLGHWGLNYFEHTLNPLRQVAPDYALEIAIGDFNVLELASNIPENVAGVVVVQLEHDD
jgi:hypothetical protein